MTKPTNQFLTDTLEQCYKDGRIPCVDLLIMNDGGEILAQKRADNRRLFPGCWEVPGGHVEDGEGFEDTIRREIKEELDVDFGEFIAFVDAFDWESGDSKYRNFQFLGSTTGVPRLTEPEKTTELRWIHLGNLDTLLENRQADDDHHYRVVKKALAMIPDRI